MSFSLDLSKFANLTEDKMEKVVIKSFIGLSTDIIKGTPIDEGRLRGNWFPAVNKFDNSTTENKDKSGSKTIANVARESNKFKVGDTLTLSNNLPYARVVEFGLFADVVGYADGPKTINGFSTQAPQGMVRINVLRWQQYLDIQARRLK